MHPSARLGIGVVAINRFGKVLVLRRIDDDDGWQMLEGGINRGESPRDAVLRELREKICTDAIAILAEGQGWRSQNFSEGSPDGDALPEDRRQRRRQKWFLVLFTGQDASIRLGSDDPEFDAWRWVSPEEVYAVAVPAKRQLYRDALEEFAPAIGNSMMLISASGAPGEMAALPSRKHPIGPSEEGEVDGGPLEITDGEVNFIQGFVHDGSIGAECGLQLMRCWGYCERHAWVSLAVEMAILHNFCSRSATLYTDILRQGIAALSQGHRRPGAIAKTLKEGGTCMICSANPRGRGLLTVAELTKAKDVGRLRDLAERSARFWTSDYCPRCINSTNHSRLCRRHLIEALDVGTPVKLDKEHQHLLNVLARLENFAWSFSWDFRGIDEPEDRAALISAIGWCSGWSSLATVIPLGHPSAAPHLRSVG